MNQFELSFLLSSQQCQLAVCSTHPLLTFSYPWRKISSESPGSPTTTTLKRFSVDYVRTNNIQTAVWNLREHFWRHASTLQLDYATNSAPWWRGRCVVSMGLLSFLSLACGMWWVNNFSTSAPCISYVFQNGEVLVLPTTLASRSSSTDTFSYFCLTRSWLFGPFVTALEQRITYRMLLLVKDIESGLGRWRFCHLYKNNVENSYCQENCWSIF